MDYLKYFSLETKASPPTARIYLDPDEARLERNKRLYRHHVIEIPLLRVFGMIMISLFVLLNNLYLAPTTNAWANFWKLFIIYVGYLSVSWLILFVFFKKYEKFNLGLFFLLVDLFFFMLAIYYSGGEKSWLFFLLMVRTADQARTTWRNTLLFAHVSTVGYILMLLYIAYVDHRPLSFSAEMTTIFLIYVSNIYLSFVSKTADYQRNRMVSAIRVSRDLIRQLEEKSAALQASENEYRSLVEGSIQGIFIHQDGVIKLANSALSRIFGYEDPEVLIGMNCLDLVASADKDRLKNQFASHLKGLPAPERLEFLGTRKDQTNVYIECLMSCIPWQGERAILATFLDITERKEAKEELQRAYARLETKVEERTVELQKSNEALLQEIAERKQMEREKEKLDAQLRQAQKMEAVGQLAGGVAHDFNNLLTVILGYSQMLDDAGSTNLPSKEGLREIHQAAIRAKDLTRQLLAFSRKQMLEIRTVDVNQIIIGFENLLERTIGENIHIKLNLFKESVVINADVSQIEQILMNLVVNARDAMPDGGTLTIETSRINLDESCAEKRFEIAAGEYIMVSVSDTGFGMDTETLNRIFEPFFTTKSLGHGTGLGLSTVYGAVKQHKGYISVYSEPGHGTTFKIYFPAINAEPLKIKERKEVEVEVTIGTTILLVEDEPALLKLACNVLEKNGYHVLCSKDELDALNLARQCQGPLHLLLTDVIMPKMKGMEIYDKISESHPETRVLYMSGYSENITARQGILKEGINFLQKPFTPKSLLRKVAETLKT